MSVQPLPRALRAAVLGGASLGLGTVGHLHADGAGSWVGVAAAAAFCAASGWLHAARRRGITGYALLLLVNQVLVHLCLTLTAAVTAQTGSHGCHGTATVTVPAGHSHGSLIPSPAMLAAHAAAGLAAAIALVLAELALAATLALASWLTRVVSSTDLPRIEIDRWTCRLDDTIGVWSSRPRGAVQGRGPPRFSAIPV